MRPVGSKLTIWIVAIPISLIVALSFLTFYAYRGSLDSRMIVDALSSVTSFVLVDLLVWERLNASLQKKLKYLHENVLFPLYSDFQSKTAEGTLRWIDLKIVQKRKTDLKKYGKFMRIALYPSNLIPNLEDFLLSYPIYSRNLQRLFEDSNKLGNDYREYTILYYLGLDSAKQSPSSGEEDVKIKEQVKLLERKEPEIVKETKTTHEILLKISSQITSSLEAFLKENNFPYFLLLFNRGSHQSI